MQINKRSVFILAVLVLGFIGGLIIAANLGWTPAIIGQDKIKDTAPSTMLPTARAFADQLSDLFEAPRTKLVRRWCRSFRNKK